MFMQRLGLRKGLVSDRYCWRLTPRREQRSGECSRRAGGPVPKQRGCAARRGGKGRFGLLFSCVYFFLLEGKFCVSVVGKTRGAGTQ